MVRLTLDEAKRMRGKTDWKRLRTQTDEDIARAVAEDPDAAPLATEEELAQATWWFPEGKQAVSIRLDRDVLDWFKAQGRRYQSRINAVLRAYVNAQRKGAR